MMIVRLRNSSLKSKQAFEEDFILVDVRELYFIAIFNSKYFLPYIHRHRHRFNIFILFDSIFYILFCPFFPNPCYAHHLVGYKCAKTAMRNIYLVLVSLFKIEYKTFLELGRYSVLELRWPSG